MMVSRSTGIMCCYRRGELHRLDGPAFVVPDENSEWFVAGKRHRVGGPAIERADGTKIWCFNGHTHRTDGPAVVSADGTKEWWIMGGEGTEEEFMQQYGGAESAQ